MLACSHDRIWDEAVYGDPGAEVRTVQSDGDLSVRMEPEKTAELEDERQTLIGQDYTFADGDEIAAFAEINDRSLRCAQIIIATIPIVCSDPFLRRYFVKGIIVGSVKG